jgi:hypothetical protein
VTIPEPDHDLWEALLVEAREFAALVPHQAVGHVDELADRIREVLSDLQVDGVREQRMFGGLAFLVGGHMAIAASREGGVLLSVEHGDTDALLAKPHTRPMVMRGRELAGWLRVDHEGVRTKRQLTPWVKRGIAHARSRPPK